ncbi:MAG: aldose 1-epimerase family protein, partial [Planctomycetota bacterium]
MIHTIQNQQITVGVKSLGAELCRLRAASGCEYLWQADPGVWAKHSPLLFPVVGRMHNDGHYQLDGVKYVMPKHGFARDSEFALVESDDASLTFELTDSDTTRACWPFSFRLRVRYALEAAAVRIGFEVVNTDKRAMYFSLGAHPALACPLQEGLEFDDYYLQFETAETADRWCLENGLLGRRDEKFLDTTDRLDISEALFADDALVFQNLKSNTLTLKTDKGDRSTRVEFDGWPDMGIWSAGAGFVCIEPWFGHDDPADFAGSFDQKPG